MSGNRRLWLLFAGHALVGPAVCGMASLKYPVAFGLEFLPAVPLLGIILCQSCLLGFWAAYSPWNFWDRGVGFVLGSVYLESLSYLGNTNNDALLPSLALLAAGSVAIPLTVIRAWRARLQRFTAEHPLPAQEGLRFSIRGLMAFTIVVAVIIAGARQLRDSLPSVLNMVYALPLWGLFVAVIGLAAVWAALGRARPLFRCSAVLLISFAFGGLFCFAIGSNWVPSYIYIISIMGVQSAAFLASLLVVRSCGYRLVRIPPTGPPDLDLPVDGLVAASSMTQGQFPGWRSA